MMGDLPIRTKMDEPPVGTEVKDEPRYRYSRQQMEEYFNRIAMPPSKRIYDVSQISDENKRAFLFTLQKHQLCKVPWENLTQHYSFHRVICIQPNYLFKKIVRNPGTGGYCMEANYFFHLILWNLGFDCYMAGSRIWHSDTNYYGGWTHVVNIAIIAGTKYLIDGGMGPNGPHRPMELIEGKIVDQISPAQMVLVRENVTRSLDRSQKMWVFKHRFSPEKELEPVYCFTDLEFLPADIESMNFEPMLNKKTFFTHKVVCVRFATDRETDDGDGPQSPAEDAFAGEIDGSISFNHDVVKWRKGGKKIAEVPCKSESERLRVLKRYFGVDFLEEDKDAVLGTAAMLTDRPADSMPD